MADDVQYRKGANVTVVQMAFHGTVVDHHVSHAVRRRLLDGEVVTLVVADDDVQQGDEVVDTAVSYLVHRHWDQTDVWLEERALRAGHDMNATIPSLMPHESVRPAGARD